MKRTRRPRERAGASPAPVYIKRLAGATVSSAVAGAALLVGADPAGAQLISAAPNCHAPFDVYAYTQAAVHACGVTTFPETGVTPLPGGGSRHDYDEGGGVVAHLYAPPSGFNPVAATDAQLGEYHFPPRPANPNALPAWQRLVQDVHVVSPPPYLAALPHVRMDTVFSANWSGYGITGSPNQFHTASSNWFESSFSGAQCPSSAEATWAGIGGWNGSGDPLGQDGTAFSNIQGLNLANHQAWFEVVPPNNPGQGAQPLSLIAGAGDHMNALTTFSTKGGFAYSGSVTDMTTHQASNWSVSVPQSFYSGDSVETIAEAPTIGNSVSNLSNFGTLQFDDPVGNTTPFDNFSPTVQHAVVLLDNSSKVEAQPSAFSNSGGLTSAFTDTFDRCN